MNGRRHVVLAVECDFQGYRPYGVGCLYEHAQAVRAVSACVDFIKQSCGGKGVFLVHTSPFVRRDCGDPFYTSRDYLEMWRRVQDAGGEVGVHLHEEEPDGSCYYYYYSVHMERVMAEHVELLRRSGIAVSSQMIGYFGMNEWITPIAEELGVTVSLNNVGKYVRFSHSNWREAPANPYFHSYFCVTKPGDSRVLEIPLGVADLYRYEDGLMLDSNSLWDLKRVWRQMTAEGRTTPCFVLLRASEIERCRARADRFIGFILGEGAALSIPSEVYRDHMMEADA